MRDAREWLTAALDALVSFMRAEQVVFYDDTWRGIPEFQHPLIPGTLRYERAILPAAAASRVVDSVVVCRQLPSPAEVAKACALAGGHSFRVLALSGNTWRDVCALGPDEHWRHYAAQRPVTDESGMDDRALDVVSQLASRRRTLLLPYQTLSYHRRRFGDQVLLCDPADRLNDKAFVAGTLADAGLPMHVPHGVMITSSSPDTYVQRILDEVDRFAAGGRTSYIKLSQRGVSGLANVVPAQHPLIYRVDAPRAVRVARLRQLLDERRIDTRQEIARVEEQLPKVSDRMGHREFTIGGMLVDGVFHPCYVGRNLNSPADATSRMVHGSGPDLVGLDVATFRHLVKVAGQISASLTSVGYRTGYSYIDMIITSDGRLVATDFNMRRGLRSAGEAWISRHAGAFYATSLAVDGRPGVERLRLLAGRLDEMGVVWYGSSSLGLSGTASVMAPLAAGCSADDADKAIRTAFTDLASSTG